MNINNLNQIPQLLYNRIVSSKQVVDRVPTISSLRQYPKLTDQALQEEGKNEQVKNEAIKKEEDKKTVNDLIRKSNRCIISISSLFPWTFFPNTIHVEESRVTFIFRQFLAKGRHTPRTGKDRLLQICFIGPEPVIFLGLQVEWKLSSRQLAASDGYRGQALRRGLV